MLRLCLLCKECELVGRNKPWRSTAACSSNRRFRHLSPSNVYLAIAMSFGADSWAALTAELAEHGGVDPSTVLTSTPSASSRMGGND